MYSKLIISALLLLLVFLPPIWSVSNPGFTQPLQTPQSGTNSQPNQAMPPPFQLNTPPPTYQPPPYHASLKFSKTELQMAGFPTKRQAWNNSHWKSFREMKGWADGKLEKSPIQFNAFLDAGKTYL